jgi:N-acyl-D-aspartate/D-glutamate deacylase
MEEDEMDLDLVIENGIVVDGSGLTRFQSDVGVKDGVIVALGNLKDAVADRRIDALGKVITPGFIDPHTHLDAQLCWDPYGLPSVLHGVTTVMTGNCGVSMAPVHGSDHAAVATLFHMTEEVPLETLLDGIDWSWTSFGEYLDRLRGSVGINVAAMVGHSVLRYYVMGAESYDRPATEEEVAAMRQAFRESMDAGAAGLSTSGSHFAVGEGGRPVPSRLAAPEELFEICDVLGEVNVGVFETDGGAGTYDFAHHVETVAGPISIRTGRPSLLGSTVYEPRDPANWKKILDTIAAFQASGARVYAQANPGPIWVQFSLERPLLFEDLPTWRSVFCLPSKAEKLAAFADPGIRDAMQAEGVDGDSLCFFDRDWRNVTIAEVTKEANQQHVGKSVAQLAEEQGRRVIDALLDLAVDEDLAVRFLYPAANSGDDGAVATMLHSLQTIVGSSDAGAHVKTLCGAGDTSLLLSRWVRDSRAMSLEEAVRRLTFDQASVIGLRNRGLVRTGYAADLVILRPDDVEYLKPHLVRDFPGEAERLWRDATGIDYVIVNGGVVVDDGALVTGELHGMVLGGTELV